MKKIINILLLGLLTMLVNPLIAQPPHGYPTAHDDKGKITNVDLYSAAVTWTVTNHTNCEFSYNLFYSFSNKDGVITGSASTKDNHDGSYFEKLSEGSQNTYNISNYFDPTNGIYQLSNISMEVSIQGNIYYVYPNASGTTTQIICTGCEAPCNCFRIDFDATNRTIEIWPCL